MYKITIISQQHYCSTLPSADPSLRVTSTITSLDVALLSAIVTLNEVSLSGMEYCGSLNDTVVPISQ